MKDYSERRKKEIKEMATGIGHSEDELNTKYHNMPEDTFKTSSVSPEIMKKKLKTPEEIIATKELKIPKSLSIPVNGRIYVISVASTDLRSPGGLILPQLFAPKKDDSLQVIKRYFVVAWDPDGIPPEIQNKLCVGIEVNLFIAVEAQNWSPPKVVDWQANQIFEVIHYTELAGISSVKPEIVEK